MEINNGKLATQYQQNLKTQPESDEKDNDSVLTASSSADILTISSEAQTLLDDGGGHPDRPNGQS